MLISPDGRTAYTASIYQRRYTYGEVETALQIFDVATLTLRREILLPNKLAMLAPYDSLVAQSADGRYVYVQNATPATSVTVVDLARGKVAGEIATPGCFGIYPAAAGHRFTSICGDGTFAAYDLSPDGGSATTSRSGKIFDVDADPLFLQSARLGGDLLFISFKGNLYRVADAKAAPLLRETRSLVRGVAGGWAPGGYQVLAYSRRADVLFVAMHPNARNGSHKDGAREIWAYGLGTGRLLSRSPVDGVMSIAVTDDAAPILFALKDKETQRYQADPAAEFALHRSHERANTLFLSYDVAVRP